MIVFKERSASNTAVVVDLATKRARESGIEKIVVASGSGDTARQFLAAWPAERIIVVRYVCGFRKPNTQDMAPEVEKELLSAGVRVVTAAHAFGGFGRAVRRKFNTYQADEIVAHALRIFGQGIKVGCEIACMACDAGLVRNDERIVSCGGTGQGSDTALVLTPANTHRFFEMKVHDILCKAEE